MPLLQALFWRFSFLEGVNAIKTEEKRRHSVWLEDATWSKVQYHYKLDGCTTQNDFIDKAILFYCGYLQSEYAGDFLPKILGETASELDVRFLHGDTCTPLLFPAYTEELEDLSPAHIFQRRIHGAGYSYRQCFDGAALNFRQYDRALSELAERHDFAIAARVAVRRLAAPFALSDSARADYLAVLREHGGPLACALAKQGDSVSLHVLLSLSVLSDAGIDAACTAAREAGQTAALSVLLAAAGPSKPRGRAKTFDL